MRLEPQGGEDAWKGLGASEAKLECMNRVEVNERPSAAETMVLALAILCSSRGLRNAGRVSRPRLL